MSLSNYYDKIDEITASMSEYLGISGDDYDMSDFDDDDFIDEACCTSTDIDTCANILENYIGNLTTVSKDPSDELIVELVEKTVKKLNRLNEKCEYELIIKVYDTATFTVAGAPLTSYLADVDDMGDFVGETEVVIDGEFAESEFRSAPYFDINIDGITLPEGM